MLNIRRRKWAVICSTLCLFQFSCGSYSDLPELGYVTGTVTLDGQPAIEKSVVFQSPEGQMAFGKTNDLGIYEINYIDRKKGAPIGINQVSISTALTQPPGPDYVDPIPSKYNSESILKADVKAGENVFDFELESQ